MIKLTPQLAQKIKEAAIELYKAKNYSAYDPDLQAVVSTIEAVQNYLESVGLPAQLQIQHRKPYESVDDL